MAKSFNFEIQKKPTTRGTYPVYIRITENRKHKRIKTSVELSRLADWNPKAKEGKHIRQSEAQYEKLNQALMDELNEFRDANRENKQLSIESLAGVVKGMEKSESFLEFAKVKIEEARAVESIGTYKQYKTTLQKLEECLASVGKKDLCFNEMDLAFLKKFEAFLGAAENERVAGRTLGKNTIAKYLKKLRKLVYEAVDEELIAVEKNPFMKFSIKQTYGSKKEKLDQVELNKIIVLDLEEGSAMWHTRNAFLFSFYCAGIRAGDLLQLRWDNVAEGRLNYTMGKTSKVRNYELVEDAKAILEKYKREDAKESDYIFPFLNSDTTWAKESYKNYSTMPEELKKALFNQVSAKNVILNKNLKKIAKLAGIEKSLTMHISRHTFANLAMRDNLPPSVIKMLLAHSSIKTTEDYMGNFSNAEADKALEKMFSKKQSPNAQEGQKEAIIEALSGMDKETLIAAFADLINKLK